MIRLVFAGVLTVVAALAAVPTAGANDLPPCLESDTGSDMGILPEPTDDPVGIIVYVPILGQDVQVDSATIDHLDPTRGDDRAAVGEVHGRYGHIVDAVKSVWIYSTCI